MRSPQVQTTQSLLSFTAHHSSGCSGASSDQAVAQSLGLHASTVITGIQAGNTTSKITSFPIDSACLAAQVEAIFSDFNIEAIKIGWINNMAQLMLIDRCLSQYPDIPVVIDATLFKRQGNLYYQPDLLLAVRDLLLPRATWVVINASEVTTLALESDTLAACAQELLALGCQHLLMTNTASTPQTITNTWYTHANKPQHYQWPRLDGFFYGSGCTLSACLAGLLLKEPQIETQVRLAQAYTWETLHQGQRLGMGRLAPNPFFWRYDWHLPGHQN